MLEWFGRLDSELVCALLERWPALEELQKASPASLRTFFRKHRCRPTRWARRKIAGLYAFFCTLRLIGLGQVGCGDGLRSDRVPSYRLLANASKAVLLWINIMESFKRTICRFFRSAKRRVTVSREVPIIWAISS